MRARCAFVLCAGLATLAACSSSSSPTNPATTIVTSSVLTAPTPDSPADQAPVTAYRPTLTVRNGSSSQSGARFYEFQISDRSDFSPSSTSAASFAPLAVVAHRTGVPEGAGGTTSFTPDADLQPTTRLYWRARMLQGSELSPWSAARSFTTPIAGYSRPGELYDPLVYGATVGVPIGSTVFVPGRGIRLNDGNAYVRYQLQQPLSSGEFSMEVEGLRANGPGGKLKVFTMTDGTGNYMESNYLMSAQYRGVNGNPDNSISFKMLLGDPALKLEPDIGERTAAIMSLDPSRTYFWKATWNNGVHIVVQEGINGRTLYDLAQTINAAYNPTPHFAYLGSNNGPFGEEDGSWPGVIYRNVWIGQRPRPSSLGSALLPQ